jgi:hypothetical protein
VVRQARVMFANNKYVCTCWTNDPTRTSCIHLMKYFTDCEDVGSHTVISSATVGLRTPLTLPLTSLVEVKYVREVKPHYAIPDEWMVELREPIGINPVQVMLSRDDGLIRVIRTMRDCYSSTSEYFECMDKLTRRKRLPCDRASHSTASDAALVARVKKLAIEELGTRDWDLGLLQPVFHEIAIENAYTLLRKGKCLACDSISIDPDNVPADLVPVL